MAAPIPAPPANPTTAPMAISAPRPRPHKLNEVFELEHLDAATPIPAPAPAPTTPKIRALRRRWLLSRTVTRATFSLRMPMSFDPSWIWIASSVTVEKCLRASSCQSQSAQSSHQSEDRRAPSNRPFCLGRAASTERESENTPMQHYACSNLSFGYTQSIT